MSSDPVPVSLFFGGPPVHSPFGSLHTKVSVLRRTPRCWKTLHFTPHVRLKRDLSGHFTTETIPGTHDVSTGVSSRAHTDDVHGILTKSPTSGTSRTSRRTGSDGRNRDNGRCHTGINSYGPRRSGGDPLPPTPLGNHLPGPRYPVYLVLLPSPRRNPVPQDPGRLCSSTE